MNPERYIKQVITPQAVLEGAGVHVRRSIATAQLNYVDPFLLFDHMGSDKPEEFLRGFPMHPHRGIETVTYVLEGVVDHRDSLGNGGRIGAGDVQWMTAGRGILHEEMPKGVNGRMEGFQLWVNMPAKLKMSAPRYREITAAQIPTVATQDGAMVKIIAGTFDGKSGPMTELYADPTFLDVVLPAESHFSCSLPPDATLIAYLFEGAAIFRTGSEGNRTVAALAMIVFQAGERLRVVTHSQPVRFLVMAGQPLHEPIARWGPFVMNTQEEIRQTLKELQDGTFIKPNQEEEHV